MVEEGQGDGAEQMWEAEMLSTRHYKVMVERKLQLMHGLQGEKTGLQIQKINLKDRGRVKVIAV